MNVLVIAAHPDDEVLGCGGTIARLAAEGHRVRIGILGEGLTSRVADRRGVADSALTALREQARSAARILGAVDVRFGGLPDNRFDSVPLLDVVKIVESWIADELPARIYTQHGGDLNIDHVVTYRATLTATRPTPGCGILEVLAYEVASSTEWAFAGFAPAFRPNVFTDITATLDAKVRAMEVYETEIRAFPHPRSTQGLRACAQRWGASAGVQAAEAFELVRALTL